MPTKAEKAFDRAWAKLGTALFDCVNKADEANMVWDIRPERMTEFMLDRMEQLSEPDAFVVTMIVGALAEINEQMEEAADDAARKRQARLPANVIDMMAALRGIRKEKDAKQ